MMDDPGEGDKYAGRSRPALFFSGGLASLADDPVVAAARRVGRGLGARAYLVGGVLRNLALGAPPGPDYDFVAEGERLAPFASAMARSLGGTHFVLDRAAPSYRVAVKAGPRRPSLTVDVSPLKGGDITRDLMARDFTVNALAVSLDALFEEPRPGVIDPSGGVADAGRKVLRTVSPGAFDADPLRVLRAVRLAQQYCLTIEGGTMALLREVHPLLAGVSAERISGELLPVFSAPGTAASLRLMNTIGITGSLMPETARWSDIGGYDLMAHSTRTVEEAEKVIGEIERGTGFAGFGPRMAGLLDSGVGAVGFRAALKLAAFFHDTGKAHTISRQSGRLRFIGHDHVGRLAVKEVLTRLRFSRAATALVSGLVGDHHRLFTLAGLAVPTTRAKANLFRAADPESTGAGVLLLLLSLADVRATIGREDAELKALVLDMLSYYYGTYMVKKPGPVLTGAEVMEAFGVGEGVLVGEILEEISSAVEAGLVKGKGDALRHVKKWLSGRGGPGAGGGGGGGELSD